MIGKNDNLVFKVLTVVAWIIFVGLCVEAGALLVNFVFSIYKPEFIQNLYQKLDLSEMYKANKWAFFSMYSFILSIALLKVYLFFIVIKLIHKLDLTNPFNNFVSEQIIQISYFTFSIGILSYIAQLSANNLQHLGFEISHLNKFWVDSQAFILMAAIVYVIASIFKKGVALQNENDLTV